MVPLNSSLTSTWILNIIILYKRRCKIQKYIKIFIAGLIVLFVINFSCSKENSGKTSPYEETQLIGYSASDSCLTLYRLYGDSAEVEIEVNGFDINITHKNAILNCCLDSIRVEFALAGDTLKLYETEVLSMGCYCLCPYEVNAKIGVAESGNYLLEIYTEGRLVYQKWIEVL
jgi:hypothetical protein